MVIGDDELPSETEVTVQRGIIALQNVIAAFKDLLGIVEGAALPIRAPL